MSGVWWAVTSGVSFGVFQAVNRRANQLVDAYQATFGLLVVATVAVVTVATATGRLAALISGSPSSYLFFGAAGVIHFFFGWTFLALSQQRIGAARTGAILASTPLIGSLLAAAVLHEPLPAVTLLGVLLVVVGVMVLSLRRGSSAVRGPVSWFALAAATSWGMSPVFIRWGLEGLPDPLAGVSVGLAFATAAYALALHFGGRRLDRRAVGQAWGWILLAGVLVAVGISAQWFAFDLTVIAVAITLMQLSAPTVVLAAPWVVGGDLERLSSNVVFGTVAVMSGSILVVLA